MHLCDQSCWSGRAVGRFASQNLLRWTLRASVRVSFFFIPAMPIDAIDFYHSMPLSLTLNLAGNHRQGLSNAKPLDFIYFAHF